MRQVSSKNSAKRKKVTMMDQFHAAKREQPDALLFFRMGDFYELFGEDAEIASRELGITLTSRSKGAKDALAMAGMPVKAHEAYLLKLVSKGYKVAICEQMEDPKTVKGIVKRSIVRVVTPGTITEENALDARISNYLACVSAQKEGVGLAWVDISTGRFMAEEISHEALEDELVRIGPAELVISEGLIDEFPAAWETIERTVGTTTTERPPWRFETGAAMRVCMDKFRVKTLEGFGFSDDSTAIPAAGALIEYLKETQRGSSEHILKMERVENGSHLHLDAATRATLELVVTQRDARREGTLLDAIDHTLTSMGGRLLRDWVLSPLREVKSITARQVGVEEFVEQPFLREEVRALLSEVLDVERLVAKLGTGRANGRDLLALARSLAVVEPLREILDRVYSKTLGELHSGLDPIKSEVGKVLAGLVDNPPHGLREGGLIREGVNSKLDQLRADAGDGKAWMARFQSEEAERSGLPGLKIGYTSVFGYYIEIPRAQAKNAPVNYTRKQTLKNAERFITPELKGYEERVLGAEERSHALEETLFIELRECMRAVIPRILATARALAEIDVLAGLAQTAAEQRYVRPVIDGGESITIRDGRHPVIEQHLNGDPFVPNDTSLNRSTRSLGLITGPNMAGKSTYIRQTALIVLLAQIGSFVPAAEAHIGVVDRIFTRLGSADDLARGASTFMVEMVEIANILNNAGPRSLVVLDEVGRGTSTYDGLALAWAIVEHLCEEVHARTLFATHYHQLTSLADSMPGVHNLNVSVREWGEEIVFLHKIVEGGTDRSYGIHVARLAGVPSALVERARNILRQLEAGSGDGPRIASLGNGDQIPPGSQLGLFDLEPSPVEIAIRKIDLDEMSPIDALLELRALKDLL